MRGNPVRKTILYGAACAVLGAAVLLVLVFAATQDRADWPVDGAGHLLCVVEGSTVDGVDADALGVISFGPERIAILAVPADVSVKGYDGRLVEVGRLGAVEGWRSCCYAVGSLLGIDVAGYAVVESSDVAAWCDALGPIVVDCPAAVTYRGVTTAARSIDIQRGRQALAGSAVLAYVAGTSSEAAADRWERVVRSLLNAAQATEQAGEAPPLRLATNLARGELACVWAALSRQDAAISVREIPTALVVRDGITRRVAKVVETEQLVASLVRPEEPLTPEDVTVAVFNGNGARLAATRAAGYLQARGFRVPRIGNADTFDYTTTTIVRLTDEARAWILRESLPGTARITTPAEFGVHYEALRPLIPPGTDLVLVVGAGMEWDS